MPRISDYADAAMGISFGVQADSSEYQVKTEALSTSDLWSQVDLAMEFIPGVRTVEDVQGSVISQAVEPTLRIRPPAAFPSVARPPRCARCQLPVRKITLRCRPTYVAAELSCHGFRTRLDISAYELKDRGDGAAIYDLLLLKFDNYGAPGPSPWRQAIPLEYMTQSNEGFKEKMMRAQEDEYRRRSSASQYANSSISSTSSIPPERSLNCCLCQKPVRTISREVYERDGHEVMFECHGRREVLFVDRRDLLIGAMSLGDFIATCRPFLSDFKKLSDQEEPAMKPKTRAGLAITIGQERAINLE